MFIYDCLLCYGYLVYFVGALRRSSHSNVTPNLSGDVPWVLEGGHGKQPIVEEKHHQVLAGIIKF